MPTNLTHMDGYITRQYVKPIRNTLAKRVLLYRDMPPAKVDVRSNQYYWGVKLERATGHGARGVGENLPLEYPSVGQQANTTPGRYYGVVSFDNMTTELVNGGVGAFVDAVKDQMEDVSQGMVFHLNRMLHGDGTGKLATVTTGASSATQTLTHPFGYSFGAMQYIEDLMYVTFLSSDGTTVRGSRKITGINWDNQTITLDTAINTTTGDLVVMGDVQGNSYNAEFKGFRHFVANTGSVFGITTTSYRRWQSRITDDTASPVGYNWNHVYRLVKSLSYRAGTEMGDLVLLMHPAMFEQHHRLYENDTRYVAKTFDFPKGGQKPSLYIDGQMLRIEPDLYIGFQELLCLNTQDLQKAIVKDVHWDNSGGGVLKPHQGKDSKYGFMKIYGQFIASQLNRFARHDGISVDSEFVSDMQSDI